MGKVKRILASKKLKPEKPIFCGIELCETVHIHLGSEIRLEFDIEQFKVFAETLYQALQKWRSIGKPATEPDIFYVLAGAYFPSDPVYNNRFEIEEQTVPSIHIHRRGLSIRLNLQDFKDYAKVVEEAHKNLNT